MTLEGLARDCAQAEQAGAGALWAVDHLFWPGPMIECLTAVTVAAAATSRAALGPCVLQLPLRHPAAVAKQVGSLQALSGGRVVLGVGAGSHPGEYEAAGVDYRRRAELLDDGIDALRSAWDRTDPTYRQRPEHARVPVWIGGASTAARRRAARRGDGWIPLFVPADAYGPSLQALRDDVEAAGRDPSAVTAAVVVMVAVGGSSDTAERGCRWLSSLYGIPPSSFRRHLVAGPPGACAEAVDAYHRAGADHVAVMITDDRCVEQFTALADALGVTADEGPDRRPTSGAMRSDLVGVGTEGPA